MAAVIETNNTLRELNLSESSRTQQSAAKDFEASRCFAFGIVATYFGSSQ